VGPSDCQLDSEREDAFRKRYKPEGERVSPVKIAVLKPHRRQSAALRVENLRLLEEIRRLRRQRGESSPSSMTTGKNPSHE